MANIPMADISMANIIMAQENIPGHTKRSLQRLTGPHHHCYTGGREIYQSSPILLNLQSPAT